VTIAEWSLLAAVLLYLLTLAPFKPMAGREFDNANPRDPGFWARLPMRGRAQGAHQNGIETFPFFATAVLLAEFRGCPQGRIDALAVAFIAIRLLFVAAYLGDRPWTRTALWNIGFVINVAIFVQPLFKG
jgi:uncharacterized MAPEG superfamily protein